ncbi:MAG: mechanosensitive ion channel domain-containing protein, partial [Alphaproteobacteria bacterium]
IWAVGIWWPAEISGGHVLNGAALVMAVWAAVRAGKIIPGPKPLRMTLVAVAVLMVALVSFNSLKPLLDVLGQMSFKLGGITMNVRHILEALLLMGVLGWLAFAAAAGLEKVLARQSRVSPALQALAVKTVKFVMLALGVLVALTALGVNITHLAVFGGALGVGIGLSLKSVSSNFLSGMFLLMDKSIKPGDVISLDDTTFGYVKDMHSRYIVLRRRDGKEVLIPNETLMNQQVINWSYTNKAVRAEVEIPVAYGSDMEQVQALLKEAVKTVPRVVAVPSPIVFIRHFGDSSVVFWVRYWNTDPEMGVNNLKGDVNMACWKALHDHGIEMPLPQRVVHMADGKKGR